MYLARNHHRRPSVGFLSLFLAITQCWWESMGHGMLTSPRSRNWRAHQEGVDFGSQPGIPTREYCAHCLNTNSGVCGQSTTMDYDSWMDSTKLHPMPWQSEAIYQEGQLIQVQFTITAHHGGHIELHICPNGRNSTAACLWEHPLTFRRDPIMPSDPTHPERGYLSGWRTGQTHFVMEFQLPEGVVGEQVLLQWHYVTANSCTPPGYREYMNGMNSQSRDLPDDLWSSVLSPCQLPYPEDLSRAAGWPERFLNCAEITIRSASSTSNNTTITTPSPQDDGGIREPTTPANASPPTPPPATPVLPPKQQDSRMVIWFSGIAPDWRHECPPADIVMQYSHVVMDYSSPLESTEEEECSCTTWSAPNRGICGGGVGGANSTNARAEHSAFVQMARQQGRRVVLGMNAHNCLVQCDLALLASQWMSLLEELEFDGLALQFLSNDAVPTWEAAQFWSNLTLHLREQLGPDAILIHRAPETHWIQGTPYFSMMPQLAPLLDFVVPFYSDVSQGFNGRGVMTNYDIAEHYQRIVWDIFSGDSTRVVFGLCIQSCNDAAVTGRDPAIVLIRALSEAYYCHGGVALDSQVADNDGGWSRPLNRVMDTSRGCSGGLVVIPMGTPAPVEPTSPVSSPISQTGDVVEGVCCPESFSGIRAMVGCNRFHHCLNGVVVGPPMTCSGGLMFDEQLQICNWPNTVVCHSRPCPTRAPTVAPTTLSNNSDGDMINNDPNLTNLPVPIPSTPRPISEVDLGTTEAPTTLPIPHSAVTSQFSPYAESILLAMLFPLLFVM